MTQAVELSIARSIPGGTDIHQFATGPLFTCVDGRRQWVGGTDVGVSGEPDMQDVYDAVMQRWSARHAYTVDRGSDADGSATIEIVGTDAEGYLVAADPAGKRLSIVSSSRCFSLPSGFSGASDW